MSTPKWKASDTETMDFRLVVDESDDTIAEVYKYAEDGDGLANARLIAAAPELLEACKSALEDGDQYRLSESVKNQLRAAIAKAKGGDDA